MFRTLLSSLAILCVVGGCSAKSDKKAEEATITHVDAKKGVVDVKMPSNGKDVEKTFKLDENIEYIDTTGKVASADIFNSGDDVLIVESEGKISQMKKKGKGGKRSRSFVGLRTLIA
jgi:hypothetical protein